MKSFLERSPRGVAALAALAAAGMVAWSVGARGALPSWLANVEAGSAIERVLFRPMPLPEATVSFPRPPAESRAALGDLLKQQPDSAELHSLRALADEQQLDFTAAEADWKSYAAHSSNKIVAQLALADYYHRRLQPAQEIAALTAVAQAAPQPNDAYRPVAGQPSWQAFERIFGIIAAQGMPKEASVAQYRAWLARYPKEESLYPRFLNFLVAQKDYAAAGQLIDDYQKRFPSDEVFPVKARAMVAWRGGSVPQGLAVYQKSFQPLWSPELVRGYFELLSQTQSLRKFLDETQAALNANPTDLGATARLFYYYQQQGKLDQAQQAITNLRERKEAAHSPWTPQELYVCARLSEDIHTYREAARYYFALYNAGGSADAQQQALVGLTNLLLLAPEAPIRLGSGNLSFYKDIATMDQGPGYLNGILSLLLNYQNPQSQLSSEDLEASPYFRRARAAELLAILDAKFPNSGSRPELHARLIEFYDANARNDAVLQAGRVFLNAFPNAPQRTQVALYMATAYDRLDNPQEEFAIYDSVLRELAQQAGGVPLGPRDLGPAPHIPGPLPNAARNDGVPASEASEAPQEAGAGSREPEGPPAAAFHANAASAASTPAAGVASQEYSRVLERYLARLVQNKEIPQALAVLRREIDRNPDDPGLYERLASFLQQNQLAREQEEVYRRAIARFPGTGWYDKLARYYLRQRRYSDYEELTRDAIKSFDGSEIEAYLRSSYGAPASMSVRVNQFALARFPHELSFVRNLLGLYRSPGTRNQAAWEALIRQHWFEDESLRNQFFEFLSSSGKLDTELIVLRQTAPPQDKSTWAEFALRNPAAADFLAEADLWRSHFESSAPVLQALAAEYPAAPQLGHTASAVYRSLAYFDPSDTAVAVKIESNLLQSDPTNARILARIGDIYADRSLFAQAAPYWDRIPAIAPGEAGGYLDAATIYWDYFDFDNAIRLLNAGRQKLANDTLYGYEEGAIFESMRDYPRAIREYARAALAENAGSPAANRFLTLARRPNFRELADRESLRLLPPDGFSLPAIQLRVSLLIDQNRKNELTPFLDAQLARASTLEQAAAIQTLAEQSGLPVVREHSLDRQASLATDPVTRLQIRYSLVRLYEAQKDFAAAQRNVEAIYRENPKILGVVRSTVDFYWRSKLYSQSINVLEQASRQAYPQLSRNFAFEAAGKATESRDFARARGFLQPLLKESPYDARYLAAMADIYSRSGDAAGLKQFYLDEIAAFRNAPMSADERKNRIATLRRGLIPALTKLNDPSGAVDQYIELLNAFPEDDGLAAEAALYAARYQRRSQLLDFYVKTVQQSPRDFRWAMVLARIQTSLEDYPAAVDSYAKAIAIRPDRIDLRSARAELLERLMRFDDAIAEYRQLYQLSYKNPSWMEKIAQDRARQGNAAETVAALKTAYIEGFPERPSNQFTVAQRLESWGMLPQSREFAEQGVHLAGDNLLAVSANHDGAKLYVRILTRLRQQEQAWSALQPALAAASASLPVLKEQAAREGIAGITDKEWRERLRQQRVDTARAGMRASLSELGSVVSRYFTPEEKSSFAAQAQNWRSSLSDADATAFALSLAQSAGLGELEARWRYELLLNGHGNEAEQFAAMHAFVELQRSRLRFAELGPQLERYVPRFDSNYRNEAEFEVAAAYRSAGDARNELRVLSTIPPEQFGGEMETHYFALLLRDDPESLLRLAGKWSPWGDRAAVHVLSYGDAALAQRVVHARSSSQPPVWNKSYIALVGLYFAEQTQPVKSAFEGALGNATIGESLGKPVDRNAQLAGKIWFYYGSRYAEYLSLSRDSVAADYLPSSLELSPATPDNYESLADFYAASGDSSAALADYNHVLELAPRRAAAHDRLALVYYAQGNRTEAIAQWKLFFAALERQAGAQTVLQDLWTDFATGCRHLQVRRLAAEFRPELDAVLRTYLKRNANFGSNTMLRSAYLAFGDPAIATPWLLDVVSAADNPTLILGDVINAPWIPLQRRGALYQRILDAERQAVASADSSQQEYTELLYRQWQIRWVRYLIETSQFAQAQTAFDALPATYRADRAAELLPLQLQLAAQLGTLDATLSAWRANPDTAPPAGQLRAAALRILNAGDKVAARKLLEFAFARDIEEHKLDAANFLGLAELRIANNDLPGAMDLLHRLVLVVGDPYQNMDSAAALLEKTGHPAEAIAFLQPLASATPWEPSYRLRLAKAQHGVTRDSAAAREALVRVASSPEALYAVRVESATALAGTPNVASLGSAELQLLAGDPRGITLESANHPFFYDARLLAARNSPDPRAKVLTLSQALADLPAREDARVPLLLAAGGAHQDELALAVSPRILRDAAVRETPRVNYDNPEVMLGLLKDDDADEPDSDDESPAAAPAPAIPATQRAQIAWTFGTSLERLGRFDEAVPYLQAALTQEKDAPHRREISAQLAAVRKRVNLQLANAKRQPVLRKELEQPADVRPRLVARAVTPAAKNGGRP